MQKLTIRMSYEDYAEVSDIVHRYTPDGRPAGSGLSTNSVKSTHSRWHAGSMGLILASPDKAVWYPTGANEYVEFSLDGKIAARFQRALPAAGLRADRLRRHC